MSTQTKNDIKKVIRQTGFRGSLFRYNKTDLLNLLDKLTPPQPLEQTTEPKTQSQKQQTNKRRGKKKKRTLFLEAPNTNKPTSIAPNTEPKTKLIIDEKSTRQYIDRILKDIRSTPSELISKKFAVTGKSYTIQIKNDMNLVIMPTASEDIISRLFQKILEKVAREQSIHQEDKVGLSITSPDLDTPVHISFMKIEQMSGEYIANRIVSILQSSKSAGLNALKMTFTFIKNPKGGSISNPTTLEGMFKKKSVKQIKNTDDYCFVYALYVALQQLYKNRGELKDNTYKSRILDKRLYGNKKLLKTMYDDLGIERKQIAYTDYSKYEQHFNVTINVIDFRQGNRCIYPISTENDNREQVYLWLIDEHYNTILDIDAFFSQDKTQKRFCGGCKSVQSLKHKCMSKSNLSICHLCHKQHDHTPNEIVCNDCNRPFENKECYDNHKILGEKSGKSICDTVFICISQICNGKYISLKGKQKHKCGYEYCAICKKTRKIEHECFIKSTADDEVKDNNKGIIFYDYEAYTNEHGQHIPNLICAYKQNVNGDSQHCFKSNNEFCTWLFQEEHQGYTCIAHYSKGYDIHHIKQYLYNNEIEIKFDTIDTGLKTLYLTTHKPNIRFIDSFAFFSCDLRSLPKTFGLTECKKGYFPLFFNKPENFNYIGAIPDKQMYGYGSMKESDAEDFDKWYDENKNKVFDFDKEFVEYCWSDVHVLKDAWNKFTEMFMGLEVRHGVYNELNPVNYITIASYCSALYKKYFMPEDSINILKNCNQNTSIVEMEWLLHLERNVLNRPIERQKKIGKYFIDGYDSVENVCYEFNGCYFHGCNKCYERNKINNVSKKTMRMLLCDTMKKKEYLETQGYTVVTMWEHDWKNERKKIIEFLHDNAEVLRAPDLNIRDSFYGGRTEVFDVYAKSTKEKKIAYADFTSLYPSVQSLCDYPIGVGRRIKENFDDINNYFGFIYCKVRPPSNLRIPVLPQKRNGKLMFDLRPKIGTWFSEELKLAVKMGYEVEEIYQIYNYEKKGKDLFGDYVRFFSKVKMENSVKDLSEENKVKIYTENLNARFPIELNKSNMCYNAGLRFIAKLCLNSLWGKFGQRDNMIKTEIIKNDPAKFFDIVFDSKNEVSSVNFLNEDVVELKYKLNENDVVDSANTNVAIASITTAWARIWLYNAFLKVGLENVLYCDTDSLIYYHNTNNNPIKTDTTLGGLTDELEGEGYIDEIVCLAPKTYSYKTSKGKVEVKAKGFRLNQTIAKDINFSSMKNIILNDRGKKIKGTYKNSIRLDRNTKVLQSVNETKIFKYGYTKRDVPNYEVKNNRISTSAY